MSQHDLQVVTRNSDLVTRSSDPKGDLVTTRPKGQGQQGNRWRRATIGPEDRYHDEDHYDAATAEFSNDPALRSKYGKLLEQMEMEKSYHSDLVTRPQGQQGKVTAQGQWSRPRG